MECEDLVMNKRQFIKAVLAGVITDAVRKYALSLPPLDIDSIKGIEWNEAAYDYENVITLCVSEWRWAATAGGEAADVPIMKRALLEAAKDAGVITYCEARGQNMAYDYHTEKAKLFTRDGRVMFERIREKVEWLIKVSGAARMSEIIEGERGTDNELMACVDRLTQVGVLKEVTDEQTLNYHRVFVPADFEG